ncbi:MAG: CFI-box-CTERM domain-containing protein, partial [Pseudobdellovibrio sp.]
MIKHLVALILLFSYQKSFAVAEVLVKAGTIAISGYSAISSDLNTVYGGIAGNTCAGTLDGVHTCNSCIDAASPVNACNQTSVYSSLKLSISFKPTKAITTAAVAKLYLEGATSGTFNAVASIGAATYTTTSTITLETTWSEVCLSAGLNSSCVNSPVTTAVLASRRLRFGIDSDDSGEIEEAEAKTVTIKFHFLPAGAAEVEQALCTTGSGIGMCNITFTPGDEKIYIDTAIYSGADSGASTPGGSVDWESIAVFPVTTTIGGEAAVYSSFANGKATPILKDFVATGTDAGSIPDSRLTGGINNYQLYCMVYATKNKTQNIYKFVTSGVDTSKTCITPSDVVGLLDDKHCFISTAAFGSESAPEVEIFRKFRNQFLVKNFFGRSFVKFYYKVSPPIAEVISRNEYLKASTRVALYPFLFFAILTLKIGFIASTFLMLLVLFGSIKISQRLHKKNAILLLLILFISPSLRADIKPAEQTIEHPQAKEGLVRIQQDGTYIYETPRALKAEASHIRLGQANQPDISISIEQTDATGTPTGIYNDYNFKDFYNEDSGLIIGYDYEWFPWMDQGKLGIQA